MANNYHRLIEALIQEKGVTIKIKIQILRRFRVAVQPFSMIEFTAPPSNWLKYHNSTVYHLRGRKNPYGKHHVDI